MASGLLEIQPSELAFLFELDKQSSCSMQFTNKSDQYVAFKVKTTNPKQYSVRPNIGVVEPRSVANVTVTKQAQKEAPADMHCRDKFLIQSVITKDGSTTKDVTAELFNKEPGKVIEECKLRVVYIPTNHPSPVPEEPEEGTSPRTSNVETRNRNTAMFDSVSKSFNERPMEMEDSKVEIIKLTEERTYALQQNVKLRKELDLLRKERNKRSSGFSLKFLLIVGLLGALVGYIMKRT